jgi:hypothetical protein
MFRILVPFFYFATTRLTDRKAVLFHAAYEWIPGLGLAYLWGGANALTSFFISYAAFISIYELGYVMNDEISHRRSGERQRYAKQTLPVIVAMASIRLAVFVLAILYLDQFVVTITLAGYGALAFVFVVHNLIRSVSLKCVTFLVLSFLRFLLPLAPWLNEELLMLMTTPVLLNYSFFRLFIYMDSKKLLSGMDRRSPSFVVGYYLMCMAFGALLSQTSTSWLPAGFSLYYLGLSVIMATAILVRR